MDRSSLVILAIALLSLLVAAVFSPRISVEANTQAPSEYVSGDSISGWLLHLAAWAPDQDNSAQTVPSEVCKSIANPFIFR